MVFFKNESNPLEEVGIGNLQDNEIYINEEGIRMVYKSNEDGSGKLLIIQESVLNLGQDVRALTPGDKPNSLALYWTLMKNKKEGKVG